MDKMEMSNEKEATENPRRMTVPQQILFAETPKGITIGVVSDSEPTPLTLLATGVAGMAGRRARRERMKRTAKPVSITSETAGKRESN